MTTEPRLYGGHPLSYWKQPQAYSRLTRLSHDLIAAVEENELNRPAITEPRRYGWSRKTLAELRSRPALLSADEIAALFDAAEECERLRGEQLELIKAHHLQTCERDHLRAECERLRAEIDGKGGWKETLQLSRAQTHAAKTECERLREEQAAERERFNNAYVKFGEQAEKLTIERDTLKADKERLQSDYNELIMQVARKFQGETRHQTALRYIREAEERCFSSEPQGCALKETT